MNLIRTVLVWGLCFFLSSCQAQSSVSILAGSISVKAPPGTPTGAFTVSRALKVPFTLPTRQTGLRLLMLACLQVVHGPVFKLTLDKQPRDYLTVAYKFKAAPQEKDRYTEVFVFDGQTFDLLGRASGNEVTSLPLDTRPYFTQARTELYVFGLSFTRAQYRQACSPIGRFNGSYCGPK